MSLTIEALTEHMHQFVQEKGWYDAESIHPQTPRNLAISLAIESAEVLEHFQWEAALPDDKRDALASELADVALYLLQIASISGIDLEEAILDKLKVNYKRNWEK
jgi:NTP pyrophosphatase (non-canonical NTP hydrolase)